MVETYRRIKVWRWLLRIKVMAETLRLIVYGHDILLAIKLGLDVIVAIVSLRRDLVSLRIEDKAFALAVILQMLMYSGRPLLGAARYLLVVYPAFWLSEFRPSDGIRRSSASILPHCWFLTWRGCGRL